MATMHQQKEKTSGIDISNMLNDVNKVLHNHLTNILTPMLQEKQNIQKEELFDYKGEVFSKPKR